MVSGKEQRRYVRAAGDEATIRMLVNDVGESWDPLVRDNDIATEDQMPADPTLAEALKAWVAGDRTLQAQDLASFVFHQASSVTRELNMDPEELAVLQSYAQEPFVAAALRIHQLREEMVALVGKFRLTAKNAPILA